MKPKLLFLFPEGWDRCALQADAALRGEFDVVGEGFDLFRFPENAQILWFDVRRFVDRLVRRYSHAGLAGVVSTNEQYGALIAATVARRLGLPGTDPVAVIRAQHKVVARSLTAAALPEASPRYTVFPWTVDAAAAAALPYPLFVKPVEAAYSVLARRVDRVEELNRHLEFSSWEKHIIRRLVQPFNDLMRDLLPGDEVCDAYHLIGEEPLDGVQVNVDGYVDRGAAHCLGVVDSVMYPGTIAFQRFEYPSRLQGTQPDTCLQTFIKRGGSRGREMKWLGSYRYATVNIGGRDREDLFRRYDSVCANLAFERPPWLVFEGTLDALRPGR